MDYIWLHRYDSVTIHGDLDWQNQLNDKNKPFFDICDGIFVNYTWKVWPFFPMCKLISVFRYYILKKGNYMFRNMQENYPRDSAAVAGDRNFDVYMGIDVFGRNTYGGGQWNVCLLLTL